MKKILDKKFAKQRRKVRIRSKISGTSSRPRLNVFKSNKHLYIQAINDETGKTLLGVSSMQKDFKDIKINVENSQVIGEKIGKKLIEKKIDNIVFDRNGHIYHGVIKSIADGIRKSGVKF